MTKAQRTHCPTGHPYDLENTMFCKDGSRKCKICIAAKRAAKQPHHNQIRLQGKIPNKIAFATGMNQYEAWTAFWAVIEAIKEELLAGNNVQIQTFGTFYFTKIQLHALDHIIQLRPRARRLVRKARLYTCLKFSPSPVMKKALNPKPE